MPQVTRTAIVSEPLLPKHGGYRKLISFQLSQLVYDITVRFCEKYVSKFSRTYDQMVQAARSGVQNIAEGSQASGTSRKTELKLTNVARASLEELKLDYLDFLRQNGHRLWPEDEPLRKALVQKRCSTAEDVATWIKQVHDQAVKMQQQDELNGQNGQDGLNGHYGQNGQANPGEIIGESISSIKPKDASPTPPKYSEIAANAALVLLGVACTMLDRQIKAQADAFIKDGGFSEKLYKTRQSSRSKLN